MGILSHKFCVHTRTKKKTGPLVGWIRKQSFMPEILLLIYVQYTTFFFYFIFFFELTHTISLKKD